MVFTRAQSLQEFVRRLRESKAITSQQEVIRFHEGYHLDAAYFFRLPNEYWDIEQDGEIFITISEKMTKRKLNIPKQYLKASLDVPDKQRKISAEMKNYILSISESEPEVRIPQDVQKYIEWGQTFKKSDDSKTVSDLYKILDYTKSGRRWYTYGSYILGENVPIGGHLALVEKFRTKKRECITLYSNDVLTGSNSYFFGIVQHAQGLSRENAKSFDRPLEAEQILAAWFSSTLFLALYLYYRREISGDYGRIKIGDMASFPCINPSLVSKGDRDDILAAFDNLKQEELPTLYDQLKEKKLRELDEAILRAIGIEDLGILFDLYAELLQELDRSETNEL